MLTRLQLLISAAVLGTPVSTLAIPEQPGVMRLGLLQSRQPFMDRHDISGSRERAFAALRLLVRRSLDEHGALDWLAAGAFPLTGPGPFPAPALAGLALTERSAEVQWFASVARAHQLSITLGGWWQDPAGGIAPRLVTVDRSGECRAAPRSASAAPIRLHMPERHAGPSLSAFAAACGRRRRYGAWIETLQGPSVPPGARPALSQRSAVVGPDGGLIVTADGQTETCLVAEVC